MKNKKDKKDVTQGAKTTKVISIEKYLKAKTAGTPDQEPQIARMIDIKSYFKTTSEIHSDSSSKQPIGKILEFTHTFNKGDSNKISSNPKSTKQASILFLKDYRAPLHKENRHWFAAALLGVFSLSIFYQLSLDTGGNSPVASIDSKPPVIEKNLQLDRTVRDVASIEAPTQGTSPIKTFIQDVKPRLWTEKEIANLSYKVNRSPQSVDAGIQTASEYVKNIRNAKLIKFQNK